ncbi:hypothetical protein ACFQ9Q_17600 [Streptomyces virginiae]|uniref:hypothetical protein n=1 Tax=Streptomyces virginiae TaxID=1961 RepID=UPI00368AFEB0
MSVESHGRNRFDHLHLWATTVTGLVALGIAVFNLVTLQSSPDIDVAMPHVVRVSQGKSARLYVQPTITAKEQTQEVEVITNVLLALNPPPEEKIVPHFFWDESGQWTVVEGKLTYRQTSDPTPVLVPYEKPQQPTMRFNAEGWKFKKEKYQGLLSVRRSGGRPPIVKEICIVISRKNVADFEALGPGGSLLFRNDHQPMPADTPKDEIDCYKSLPSDSD